MKKSWIKVGLNGLLAILIVTSSTAKAEFLDIASQPLQTSGSSVVLPNIMFILDDSGSMAWDYTPDWANGSAIHLFRNADYNAQYYNPEVLYTPPVDYRGISMGNQTSFTSVENDVWENGATKNGITNLTINNNASFYAYVPGEYCTTASLTSCVATSAPTATHKFAASIRWCNDNRAPGASTATTLTGSQRCQAIRNDVLDSANNTFVALRQPIANYTLVVTAPVLTGFTSQNITISSVKINNMELLNTSVTATIYGTSYGYSQATNSNTLATTILNTISACSSVSTNSYCRLSGNTVTRSNNVLSIRTLAGAPLNSSMPIQVTMSSGSTSSSLNSIVVPGSLTYVTITSGNSYATPGKTTKSIDRTDCSSTVCTYNEEMTNFANWWAYYKTRRQAMRTAATLAFKSIDYRYRVGFVTINNNQYLPLNTFNTGQKQLWYQKLYASDGNNGTPLRSSLNNVGRMYAGKKPFSTKDDPVQYACQKNYALLTTDGYWSNETNPISISGSAVGNIDGGATPRPLLDSLNASNTLADISKYYFDNDIRTASLQNCSGGANTSVCGTEEDFPKQNMVTLTLGLGIDGTLAFTDDYKTQTIGDFADLKSGAKSWPNPILASDGRRIDDLWHAAVNAGGTYYSAKNPKLLRDSLIQGLSEIKSITGAGSAAAASSLAPVAGDNFQYVASYQTVKWIGNLEARQVDTRTLRTSRKATWCAETIAASSCTLPSIQVSLTENNTTSIYCKTTSSNQNACDALGGIIGLGGEASSCYVEVGASCTGRLQNQISAGSRVIYFNKSNTLTPFRADTITPTVSTDLNTGYLALSQFTGLSPSDTRISDTTKVNKLIDYLVGNKTYEDRASNAVPENRLFRERQASLGDITESRPAYYKAPILKYSDAGFNNFKTAMANRTPVVYVGANDGMLHAFNANTGDELWAFIPTPVIKNLPALADKEYGTVYHKNYVNGSPLVTDICISGCSSSSAVWKTILVSGLNGGGRGYFALDVTTPSSPKLLWEFYAENTSDKRNIGLSYGNPVITKLKDGKWVVLLTSGYNNGTNSADKNSLGNYITNNPQGDGKGYLYIINAYSGAIDGSITTNEGDSSNPSGLAKINYYADNVFENNAAEYVYGGDLNGNVWRFDINDKNVVKIASLKDTSGNIQKITTIPEIGSISNSRILFIGTGKFLENSDLLNTPGNSVYGFKDNNLTAPFNLSGLVTQTLATNGDQRTVSSANKVDFSTKAGWRINLPSGERVNVDPILIQGALVMPSIMPNSSSCEGAGYGWFNYFNYKTGGALPNAAGVISERLNSPSVGFNISYKTDGSVVISNTSSTDPTPSLIENSEITNSGTTSSSEEVFDADPVKAQKQGYGTKHIWRELIVE